jgi:hypothetical protein
MGCHPDICDIAAATLGLFVKANGITRAIMKLSKVDLACNPIRTGWADAEAQRVR